MVFVCSICQDVLLKFDSDNEGGAVSGECGHVFHQYCLNEWLRYVILEVSHQNKSDNKIIVGINI